MSICESIPNLEICYNFDDWNEYYENLYCIFCKDFKESYPMFEGNRVKIRYNPIEYGKEEGFHHVTCQDYTKSQDRVPDINRCERIRWVRWFIENYDCDLRQCYLCSGIIIWDEPYKNTYRTHILLEEEKYMVVVEKRERYNLLITAYYFDQDHSLQKKLKKYEEYK